MLCLCSWPSSARDGKDGQEEIEKTFTHMTRRLTLHGMLLYWGWFRRRLRINDIKVKHSERDADANLVPRCGRVHIQQGYAMSPNLTIWGLHSINLVVKWWGQELEVLRSCLSSHKKIMKGEELLLQKMFSKDKNTVYFLSVHLISKHLLSIYLSSCLQYSYILVGKAYNSLVNKQENVIYQ